MRDVSVPPQANIPAQARDGVEEARLTIVIPVYNEGKNIREVLTAIGREVKWPHRIVIVYDFDEDDSVPVVETMMASNGGRIELVKNVLGRGVLNAIKTGFSKSATEFIIVTMADLSDPPDVINAMMDKAVNGKADIVCASRYMRGGKQIGGPLLKKTLSRLAGMTLYSFTSLPVHDITNSFKLYRRNVTDAIEIESKGAFEIGMEMVIKAHLKGYAIAEVPTIWRDRVAGNSNFRLGKFLPAYLRWYLPAFPRCWAQYAKSFFYTKSSHPNQSNPGQ